jgi:hypothetical protein
MKIYQNVLSEKTLDIIHDDIEMRKYESCWSSGNLIIWDETITRNITGTVIFKKISDEISSIITEELKLIIPADRKLYLNYNLWYPNSGISWHNDGGYKYGFTLYLNRNWDLNWGGLFMWEDYSSNEYKMFPPEYNTLILNDNREYHAVSIISPTVNCYRLTIQGFCE